MGVCFFVVVGLCACALYLEVLSVIIHFSATDPLWSGFPQDCTYQTPSKVYNCVRVGKNIVHPHQSTGPMLFPLFSTNLQNFQMVIADIFDSRVTDFSCSIITQKSSDSEVFFHYRCLSYFLGYPDDLAIKLFCEDELAIIWVHSQSRLGEWDHNWNDMRVRLLYNVINTPLFNYNKTLHNGGKCVPSM